jgi:F-type H+-transporting ATPase subunit gamma
MALRTRAIKQKIASVKNIRKITKAMEMVAVSKMKRAVGSALMTRTYSTSALDLLAALVAPRKVTHPLLVAGVGERTLMVVVASNRGLCGGFNVSLAKAVSRSFAEYGGRESVDFVTIGKNAERLARKLGADVRGSFVDFSETAGVYSVRGLHRLVLEEFLSGRYARVVVAYNKYVSAVRYEPVLRPLLPISEIATRSSFGEGVYLFEPDESAVLEEVLPQLVAAQLYQMNLESVASEQSARMVAMKNASESAGEMISDLALDWNRARQDGITQEISEIAAGANALAV